VKAFLKTVVLMLILSGTLMASQRPELQTGPVEVSIDMVTLKDVGSDRILFDVRSHVTSSRALKIKRIRFEQMRMGNLPVYLSSVEESVTLEKGSPVTLPAIPLTIYFRDLDSLEPLEKVVREQKAVVQGNARVDLELNLLERIVGGPDVTHADAPVKVTAAVEIPGGVFGQSAALATLGAAQLALDLGGSGLNTLRQSQKTWESEVRTQYIPALVVAESRYALLLRNNQRVDVAIRGLGFRISPDEFVVTGEMIEPWKYDPDVAAALQTGDASLVEGSRDLRVWPSGDANNANSARSLSQGAIQVVHAPRKAESTRVVVDKKDVKVQIFRRDSDVNYAVLRFVHPEDKGQALPSRAGAVGQPQSWERLILFRIDDNGKLESVPISAHRQDSRILLDDPVDDHAFGSLLIAPEGAVGMVQSENSGMGLRANW